MRIPFQALLAVAVLFFSGGICGGNESLYLSVKASPSTFKAVGDTITFTYTATAQDSIAARNGQPWGLTDDAADSPPSCGLVHHGFTCTATHVITAEDFALGYVTSHATARAYVVSTFGPLPESRPVDLTATADTVVYLENFTPSPTPTLTPLVTATPVATVDAAPNAEVIFEKGNTTDLVDCSGTEFAFTVKDPQGVRQVYIEFAVAGFNTDFSTIAGTLDLTNSGGDTWSGTLNDTFSTQGKVTYWRVVVVDNNGIQTVYHEEGKFSFYARNKSCK